MADCHYAACPVEGDERVKTMTEQRLKELAAEALERHKDDPEFMRGIPRSGNSGTVTVRTPSDAFWYWWGSGMKKKGSSGPDQSLSYKGQNDPTANTAIKRIGRIYRVK